MSNGLYPGVTDPPIKEPVYKAESKVRLFLELNAESVSMAVSIYIRHKISQLVQERKYDDKTQDTILLNHLSLECKEHFSLGDLGLSESTESQAKKCSCQMKEFPLGLDSLYERMIAQNW